MAVLAMGTGAFAQEPVPADTTSSMHEATQPEDSLQKSKTTRIAIHLDYLSLVSRLISKSERYEGGVSVFPVRNFAVVAEAGFSRAEPKSAISNGSYAAEGYFGKAGVDYYLVNGRESRIYLGARYAMTSFDDRYSFVIASDLWPDYTGTGDRENLEASWYEALLGTEGVIVPGLYLGWTLRYRMIRLSPSFSTVNVYHIPGYGPAGSKNSLGVNLYLKYAISW